VLLRAGVANPDVQLMRALLDRRVLFVGGKGGVGKTTCASALGLAAADDDKRCLLVSTDPAHSLGDIFGRVIGQKETQLVPHLTGIEIDPDVEADRHIETVKTNMRGLVRPELYGEVGRQMDLARLAPGAVEAALLERVADLIADGLERFDLVIFDTAPTGHTLRLLSLPEVMAAWTDGMLRHRERSERFGQVLKRLGGKRNRSEADDLSDITQAGDWEGRRQGDDARSRIEALLLERRRKFHRARRTLLDPGLTAFIMVLTPEHLPILETRKALALLRKLRVPVAALIVNRIIPNSADGRFLEARRRQEAEHLREIESLFPDLPKHLLPLLERDVEGINTLRRIAAMLVA
jgi:arsenite/tail-anchored protein-transporting ATPase